MNDPENHRYVKIKTGAQETSSSVPRKKTTMRGYVLPAAFFTFSFFYLLLYIDPRVIYSCNGFDLNNHVRFLHSQALTEKNHLDPYSFTRHFYILELTGTFLKDIASAPGGLTHLLVTLAIYACHYPVIGAFSITCFAWLLFFLFQVYVRRNGGPRPMVWSYLPPLFVLAMCNRYNLNYLACIVPVLGALAAAVIYQRLPRQSTILRSITFSVLFWLTYYFFQWSCLLFILLAGIQGAFQKPKTLSVLGIASILNMAVAYIIECFYLSPEKTFNLAAFFTPPVLPIVIIGYIPFFSIVLNPATARFLLRRSLTRLQRPIVPSAVWYGIRVVMVGLMVSGVTAWAMNNPINIEIRTIARTLHHIQYKQWDKILRENCPPVYAKFPEPNRLLMIHATNRALCNTGQLGSKMYYYPQSFVSAEPLLLLQNTSAYGYPNWFAALDLFMDLGALNYAEKIAGETMENMGPYPFLMYRRAVIQLAKGNTDAASVYFNKLSGMPFYRKEAQAYLNMRNDDAAIASDTLIAYLRARMDTTNNILYLDNEETILLDLLKSNPRNKMVYEYLMAYYLQTGNMEKIAGQIHCAAGFGYTLLPRHWEEALRFYLFQDSTLRAKFLDLPLRPGTSAELNRFLEAYDRGFNEPARMAETASLLEREFGRTYFYYIFKISNGAK
jgi:hypothetical protein